MVITSLNLFTTSRNLSIKADLELAEAVEQPFCVLTHI